MADTAGTRERGSRALAALLDRLRQGPGTALCCAACGHPVTLEVEAREVGGAHAHHCENPSGLRFHLRCFRTAFGCGRRGTPTTEATWFEGYAWTLDHCLGCGIHLGWAYHAGGHGDPEFHGLIADRLRPGDPGAS